ncbi:MAG TPA: sugar phosphate nucleotidyltransferase [Methanocorpusculum sp.]|nr:sugar phosphate nucleotidyltransferase [Methanocorpusculum sp.]
MYKVKKAIIIAAGMGERLRPVTWETPKPLVKVKGVSMIETEISALHKNGINEIYIVVGYLKEKFNIISEKYPKITLIDNPYAAYCNNISSLYCAKEHLNEDVIILDGDLLIRNSDILSPEFQRSGYNCIQRTEQNNEWTIDTDENGIVSECNIGGCGQWQLYGISRWCKDDAEKLKYFLEIEFEEKKNIQKFWDELALFNYRTEFQLGVREIQKADVTEIDNLDELIALDKSYLRFRLSRGHI